MKKRPYSTDNLMVEVSVNGSGFKNPMVVVRHRAGGGLLAAETVPVCDYSKRQDWIGRMRTQHGGRCGDELSDIIPQIAADVTELAVEEEGGDSPREPTANLQTSPSPEEERDAIWQRCRHLAESPRILDGVAEAVGQLGVVGADRQVKITYLAMTSRVLDRPVSLAIKGPSASGKSYPLEQTLKLFPSEAHCVVTAMSERALIYDEESLEHRMIVIYEAGGIGEDLGAYFVRSLLSEGRIRYKTVEKTDDGLRTITIDRPGPTGLITTTTRVTLHPENETRLLSITVSDSPDQTRKVFAASASEDRKPFDTDPWQDLQRWIGTFSNRRVTLPYAQSLAALIPTTAVRLRRDFVTLLNLIRAHAILHQAGRDRDDRGRIIATLDDYAAVRELVADLMAEGVEVAVSRPVRETVEAVRVLRGGSSDPITMSAVARHLNLDVSAASRRVHTAIKRGYLKNEETRERLPARLVLGDTLPDNSDLLPRPELLSGVCRFASEPEGVDHDLAETGESDAEMVGEKVRMTL